jgi:hypothetical protein
MLLSGVERAGTMVCPRHALHRHPVARRAYISAGMVAKHMEDAVYSRVDGVGIGTSTHYVDASTKLVGALKPDAIRVALTVRDEDEERRLDHRSSGAAQNTTWYRPWYQQLGIWPVYQDPLGIS